MYFLEKKHGPHKATLRCERKLERHAISFASAMTQMHSFDFLKAWQKDFQFLL